MLCAYVHIWWIYLDTQSTLVLYLVLPQKMKKKSFLNVCRLKKKIFFFRPPLSLSLSLWYDGQTIFNITPLLWLPQRQRVVCIGGHGKTARFTLHLMRNFRIYILSTCVCEDTKKIRRKNVREENTSLRVVYASVFSRCVNSKPYIILGLFVDRIRDIVFITFNHSWLINFLKKGYTVVTNYHSSVELRHVVAIETLASFPVIRWTRINLRVSIYTYMYMIRDNRIRI